MDQTIKLLIIDNRDTTGIILEDVFKAQGNYAVTRIREDGAYNNESYDTYPDLYNNIDIFISPSTLEGGPVPVLEAMLSNCFPIASKTGFCPDIISDGKNGFLFDIDADYTEVIRLIKLADSKTIDVRQTALEHSWKNCSQKIDTLFQE